MLMMPAFWAPDSSRTVTSDARDAPFGGLPPEQSQAADAHDARFGCPILEGNKQLMMLALGGPDSFRTVAADAYDSRFSFWGLPPEKQWQLMLMTLAWGVRFLKDNSN